MSLVRLVAFHDVEEAQGASRGPLRFALAIARAPEGVVLVLNRYRRVWELPGGLIDPGENARSAAARELAEEAGAEAGELEWLGVIEVDGGSRYFGAVFRCAVNSVSPLAENEEIDAVGFWRADAYPEPLGPTDAALLARFGQQGPINP